MKKTVFTILLAIVLFICSFSEGLAAITPKGTVIDSGYSGDIKWTLSSDNVLYLEGSGEFAHSDIGTFHYDNNEEEHFCTPCIADWAKYNERIKRIEVNVRDCTSLYGLFEGVTTVLKPSGELVTEGSPYSSLEEIDFTQSDLSKVENMAFTFLFCPVKRINMANMDVRNVYTMYAAFSGCYYLEELDLTGWNTQSLSETFVMFSDCNSLVGIKGIEGFNTSHVRDFTGMFQQCSALAEIDVSRWNTGSAMYTDYMFAGCERLKTVDVSAWDVSNLESARSMFSGCENLEIMDLSKWNAPKLDNIEYMFAWCFKLKGGFAFSSDIHNYEHAFYAAGIGDPDYTIFYSGSCSKKLAEEIALSQAYASEMIRISEKKTPKEYRIGDVDKDGFITAADARLALRVAVGLEEYPIGSEAFLACDVNEDAMVTTADARLILRTSINLESRDLWLV